MVRGGLRIVRDGCWSLRIVRDGCWSLRIVRDGCWSPAVAGSALYKEKIQDAGLPFFQISLFSKNVPSVWLLRPRYL